MEENIEILLKGVSNNLIETEYVLDILYQISDGDGKIETLLNLIGNNTKTSFKNIEFCRKIIFGLD